MKLVVNITSPFTLLFFLALFLGDCLHWYALPHSHVLRQSLYAAMVILSLLSCLLFVRHLNATRQLWDKIRLKLVAAPKDIETKFEEFLHWSVVSDLAALCCHAVLTIWGGIYLSDGPLVQSGYASLLVLVAYLIIGFTAALQMECIKRSMGAKKTRRNQNSQ